MRKTIRRVLLTALVAGLMLAAGCGKNKNNNVIDKNAIFREEAKQLKVEGIKDYNQACCTGSTVYIIGNSYDDEYNTTQHLVVFDVNTGDAKKIPINFEIDSSKDNEFVHHSGWVQNIMPVKDGVIIMYNAYFSDETDPDNPIWEDSYKLYKVNTEGKVVKSIDLSKEVQLEYVDSCYEIPGGLFIFANNTFYQFDENLELKQKKESSINWINSCFSDKSGQFYIGFYDADNNEIHKMNPDTLEVGDKVEFPFSIYNYTVLPGNDKYDILLQGSTCVYGYNWGDAEPTPVFNMIDSDVESDYFNAFCSNEDGTFVGVTNEWNESGSEVYVSKFTKVAPEDVKEKKVITLGCIYLDGDVRKEVVNFNKTNPDYRISIKDYSIYSTDEDYDGGQKKFNSDIISGKGPDIIMSSNSSMIANYRTKGLFMDLYKFMDDDPDIDKNDIFPSILKVCEYDGKLYEIVPMFYVETLAAKTSKMNGKTSWTFSEMVDYEKTLPEGTGLFGGVARESFLQMCLAINNADFMDVSKGKCYFDTDEFKALLEYSKKLPTEDTDEFYNTIYGVDTDTSYEALWREDKAILYDAYIYSPEMYKQILKGYFGEDITFIGYPSTEGNGGGITYYNSVALSSKCSEPEIAWEFIKRYYTEDYQSTVNWGIPASMKQFDKLCERLTDRPYYENEDGTKDYYDDYFWLGETQLTLDPLTADEVAQLKNYIMSLSKSVNYVDDDILEIIKEEAAPFYEGQKTVDEVTPIIQSRISIYINERQ